jgi:hypothetical protein
MLIEKLDVLDKVLRLPTRNVRTSVLSINSFDNSLISISEVRVRSLFTQFIEIFKNLPYKITVVRSDLLETFFLSPKDLGKLISDARKVFNHFPTILMHICALLTCLVAT